MQEVPVLQSVQPSMFSFNEDGTDLGFQQDTFMQIMAQATQIINRNQEN
jgi:hypothetical protein